MGVPGRIWRPGRVFNGSAVLIRIDWLGAVCSRSRQEGMGRSIFGCFSFVFKGIMARIDWLRDVGAGFGQAVLAVALEFGVFFDEKWWMVRLDWEKRGARNGWEGCGGRKGLNGGMGRIGWLKMKKKSFV